MSYTALLTDTCSVVRRTAGAFDPGTGTYPPASETTLYSGSCRVDAMSGAGRVGSSRVNVGEEAVVRNDFLVFLPPDEDTAKPEDIVIVISSEDGAMVGRELVVKANDAAYSPNSATAMRALLCEDFQEGP